MTEAAEHDKDVEDVVIGVPSPYGQGLIKAVKNSPYGVKNPSCKEPNQPFSGDSIMKRLDGDNNQPSHEEVECCRGKVMESKLQYFHQDSQYSKPPHNPKYTPSPS